MNVLAYSTQDPAKVAAKLDEKLRDELGLAAPVPYTVEQGAGTGVSVGSMAAGLGRMLFGGTPDLMYTLVFDVPTPRPMLFRAHVNRQGVGCHVGALLYMTRLAKPFGGEVTLDEKKAAFVGEPGLVAKLNANKDLVKRLDKLARTKANVGGIELTVPRLCAISADQGGTRFVVGTLGRGHAMGFKMSLDAKELLDVAALVEATI
jgi:hypothetical protein